MICAADFHMAMSFASCFIMRFATIMSAFYELFNMGKTKQCKFPAYVAFNKATNGQTDINHDKAETLSSMSLSMDQAEMHYNDNNTICYTYIHFIY